MFCFILRKITGNEKLFWHNILILHKNDIKLKEGNAYIIFKIIHINVKKNILVSINKENKLLWKNNIRVQKYPLTQYYFLISMFINVFYGS